MKYNIELTIEQINVVLSALSRMPYDAVFGLIPVIQEQAKRQMDEQGKLVNGPPK